MRIKIDSGEIKEFPDDLAVMILADPTQGDPLPNMDCYEVGMLVHYVAGLFHKEHLSYEENLEHLKVILEKNGPISDVNRQIALDAIALYELEVTEETMGLVDPDDVLQFSNKIENPFEKLINPK